jgi:hypothetical protein
MRLKQNSLVIILALTAGFIGGIFSNQLFVTEPAFAEKQQIQQKVVIAEEFRVVDKFGNIIGSFGIPPHLRDIVAVESSSTSKQPHQIAQLSLGNNRTIVLVADGDDGNVKIGGTESSIVLDATRYSAHLTFRKQTQHSFVPKIRLTTLKGTHISLQDDEGNERVLIGNRELAAAKPGVKNKNPVSSIVLFNEKNDVVWSVMP